jgi:glycine/D-amino acid oxidase-like deaminating enzyme/nitrite reductase/ring-hydroxylating ferredoxin subunit
MNASEAGSHSIWMDVDLPRAPVLDRQETADVVIVGAGIAGLSTAYELTVRGKSVVVLDRGVLGGGMTSRTTAHLASALDDLYHKLVAMRGEDIARQHYESQSAAVDRIEHIQADESIACDFKRLEGYLFAPTESDVKLLDRELDACRSLGVDVDRQNAPPIPGETVAGALRFRRQARFHPTKYLAGLVQALEKRGARLFADTCVTGIDENETRAIVSTDLGHEVHAEAVVVATNTPIHERVTIHSKQAPYRSYVIAFRAPPGAITDALYWDTLDPYHYVRLQEGAEGECLIVGGEDHRTGLAQDIDQRFVSLEAWARKYFPMAAEVTHRWSGQVMEPIDYCAFIGLSPGRKRTYVATGDSGQGITGGVAAGLLLADLIADGKSRWEALYDPSRKPVRAAAEFARENAAVVKNYAEYLTGGDVASLDALAPGQGALVRRGTKKIAAYRDQKGNLHLRSAACPHAGCIVHWNGFERCWDCPCHGSQFQPDGKVISGPAISALDEIDR